MNDEHTSETHKQAIDATPTASSAEPTHSTPEVMTASPVRPEMPQGKKKQRFWMWTALISLIVVIGIVGGIAGIVYFMPSNAAVAPVRTWLVNVLPLPVAISRADGALLTVSLKDYESNVAAAEHFFAKQEEYGLSLATRPTAAVLREQEYDRELEVAYTARLAKNMNITVSPDDINAYYTDTILPQAASEDEIVKTLKDLYDWNLEEFKKSVLYPVVLRKKITEAMAADGVVDQVTKDAAQKVLDEVKKGEKSFDDLAKQYSDDSGSATNGGALGSFGKDVMVKEFEDAAFALQVDQVSELVKTDYGYHIIKVTGRDDAAGTVSAQHILIAFETVDSRVDDLKKDATVYSFLPHYTVESETSPATVNPYTNTNSTGTEENTNSASTNVNSAE